MIYFSIYILTALAEIGSRQSRNINRHLYPAILILFFVLTAFRFEVGCDWGGYLNQFFYGDAFEIQDVSSQIRDPLWWLYVRIMGSSGISYPWLNILPTVLFFTGIHLLGKRQPQRLSFLVLLWPILIINIGMSALRQAAVIGIICIAFNAFVDRKLPRFIILILLASTIHSSAMVFLLLAPLVNGSYSKVRVALAAILAIPGTLLLINWSAAEVGLSRYVNTDIDAAGAAFRVGLLSLSGIVFLIFLRRPWLRSGASDYKLVSIGSLGMIALAAILPISTVIADRLGYYFVPIQALMFARISHLTTGRFNLGFIVLPYIVLGVVLAVWLALSSHYENCYTPYRTWLFGMPEGAFGL